MKINYYGVFMFDLLLSSYQLDGTVLKNRVVMAPMTRNRCVNNIPGEMVAIYYAQRAEAGLIITEGTSPSLNGLGYPRIPGLFNQLQVQGWKKVTDAVHRADGKIFVQLMHTGRVSHSDNLPPNGKILAPSAKKLSGQIFTDISGMSPYPTPEEMSEAQIENTIEEYASSAELAILAGFDGVEIHAANGYLVDQFLNTASNARLDSWGGSVENRIRFASQVAKRIAERIGPSKVGMRLSPFGTFNGMEIDFYTAEVYEQLAKEMNKIGIVCLHVIDLSSGDDISKVQNVIFKIRNNFKNTLILSGGYDPDKAEQDLTENKADLIAFGRPFIANPKLITKIKNGKSFIEPDASTFYTVGEKGFIDYPSVG